MILQLALSLIMPILLCIAFCYWLCETFALGSWIYIPGILFGLGGSVMSGYKFYLSAMKLGNQYKRFFRNKKKSSDAQDDQKKTISFNDHI